MSEREESLSDESLSEDEKIFWNLMDYMFWDFPESMDDEEFDRFIQENFPYTEELRVDMGNWKGLYIEISNHAGEKHSKAVSWLAGCVFGIGRDDTKRHEDLKKYYLENRPKELPPI